MSQRLLPPRSYPPRRRFPLGVPSSCLPPGRYDIGLGPGAEARLYFTTIRYTLLSYTILDYPILSISIAASRQVTLAFRRDRWPAEAGRPCCSPQIVTRSYRGWTVVCRCELPSWLYKTVSGPRQSLNADKQPLGRTRMYAFCNESERVLAPYKIRRCRDAHFAQSSKLYLKHSLFSCGGRQGCCRREKMPAAGI